MRGLQETPVFGSLTDTGPQRSWLVARVAAVVATVIIACRLIAGWDIWWHLAVGRQAVTERTFPPAVDAFSFTAAGHPYNHLDVIADSVFYLMFDNFEYLGIALIKAFAVLVGLWGLKKAGPDNVRPLVWLAVCGLYLIAIQHRLIPRPLIFSLAFFPMMLGLIERGRATLSAHGDRSQWEVFFIAMLPAIAMQFVWINLHRAGLFGLILLTGHACALGLAYVMAKARFLRGVAGPRPTGATVGISFAIAGIAGAIGIANPNGIGVYTTALDVTQGTVMREQITEWIPITPQILLEDHPFSGVLILLAGLTIVVRLLSLLGKNSKPGALAVWHLGVYLVFLQQTLVSARSMSYLGAVCAVILIRGVDEALDAGGGSPLPPRTNFTLNLVVAALSIAGLIHFSPHTFGLGSAPNRYPASALDAADAMELGPNVQNNFVYGGYVVWDARFKVAIDGRNDMLYTTDEFMGALGAQRSLDGFAEFYFEKRCDWVLADNTPGRQSFLFLAGHPDWMPVYWSEEAVIYVLRPGNSHLEQYETQVLNPINPMAALEAALQEAGDNEEQLRPIRRELIRASEGSPRSLRLNALLARYYHHTGQRELVRRSIAAMESASPGHPSIDTIRRMTRE
ncbi:MAG: hypothetical protein ACJAYU_004669 [Bradymonadia bacterium]